MKTTIARGIKTPIIKAGDKLDQIIVDSIFKSMKENNYELNDRDVIGITESVVSISNNNYASLNDIADDINNKFKGEDLGLVFPMFSRNRYSMLLKAFAIAKSKLTILISYPFDEVGNPVMDEKRLRELKINPYNDVLTHEEYESLFGDFKHPITGVNIIDYYKEICEKENTEVTFVFSNNPLDILKYTKNVLVSDVHNRLNTKSYFKDKDNLTVYSLDDILTSPVNNSGYNKRFGLLGTNKATNDKVKLFPNHDINFLNSIQNKILNKTGKHVEVFIYGDGGFKDPASGIWELADPVISPSYTKGLEGSPNEIKLKYLIDNEFSHLSGAELEMAVNKRLKNKGKDLKGEDISLGTTPRMYVNLLGSLCDLVSGSGDKGTPVVLIQNYF